jgi:hypothetical protein
MMTNVGVIDGVFRFLLGLALLAWSDGRFGHELLEVLAWIIWVIGAYIFFTGVFRFCPAYAYFSTNSCATGLRPDDR